MAFRNIIVESPARICVKNRQLVIHTDSDHAAAAVFSQVFCKKESLKPLISGTFFRIQFYHTKKCEGPTTIFLGLQIPEKFYHTKKCEGTTTLPLTRFAVSTFYHTKKCEGTTTA